MPLFGELFLSEVVRKPIFDPKGEEVGRLRDLVIVKGEPLPKVSALVIERRKSRCLVPWTGMSLFNKRIISLASPADTLIPYESDDADLLAARDILDNQIVDANGARVVRVNDIKFEGYESEAVLVAVDVGFRGILRRLGFERAGDGFARALRTDLPSQLISWNYMQPLEPKLSKIALTVPRQMMAELHPADIADLISQVSPEQGAELVKQLDEETAAEALSELETNTQTAIIRDMDAEDAADIIEEMSPDSAADLINELPAETASRILTHIEQEDAEDIQELLSHESHTAGGMMTNLFVSCPPDTHVRNVIELIRREAEDLDTIHYVYAQTPDEKLVGVASIKDILLADPMEMFSAVMETNLKFVPPEANEFEVAAMINKYNLVALPVVDADGVLHGVVTVDDVLDRMLPKTAKRLRRSV